MKRKASEVFIMFLLLSLSACGSNAGKETGGDNVQPVEDYDMAEENPSSERQEQPEEPRNQSTEILEPSEGAEGIVGLSGCSNNNTDRVEEQGVESGNNNVDTSRLFDEYENMKIHWENDSIDVDGNGIVDYAIVGTINEGNEYRNILEVMLDDGKTAVLEFQGVTEWREDFITVRTDKLHYTDKDSIVIQFTESTSNYGSSDIHILSVNADADEMEIIEEVTILDGGVNSQVYSLYEKTVMIGEITVVSMTPEDELIQYVEKLGVNAVAVSDYNCERTQYIYWSGEKWEISE